MDSQSAFGSLHQYGYGKTFPAFPLSCATATAAMEQKNSNGTTEHHNGTAMAERQWKGGNQTSDREKVGNYRHNWVLCSETVIH